METLFTKIISGEIPSYKIAEDAYCFAFLDIHPNTKGHVLCVPKTPIDQLFDLPEKEYQYLMNFSRKVAKALYKAIPCQRIGMSVVGLEVPHAHVHLIPIQAMEDMTFQKKESFSIDEMEATAALIAQYLKED
ncbi:MAG: HIT family protein [Flavobacteriaceae bacterium]|jgi:histidine triad (HIT) family protein